MNRHTTRSAIRTIFFTGILFLLVICSGCGSRSKASLELELSDRQSGLDKMAAGDYIGAIDAFQSALDQSLAVIGDLEADICYYKALAQVKSGDTTGAFATYSALIDYDKRNAQAYYLRACLFLQQEDMESAKRDFRSALDNGKQDFELYINVAKDLQSAGEKAEASDILRRTLKWKIKEKAEDYRNLGYVYYLLGEYDSACQYLDKAAAKSDATAVLYLAQVYEAEGKPEQSASLLETYLNQNEGDPKLLNRLGCQRMETGNYDQALTLFRAALALEEPPNLQELRRNEVAALECQSDFKAAQEKMAAYVRDYPEDEQAQREYVFLQTR